MGSELSLRRWLRRSRPLSPLQDQIQIAEFVPEIFSRNRFVVGSANFFGRQKRARQIEMARLGLVQAREQAIDGAQLILTID